MENFKAKGYIYFAYSPTGLMTRTLEKDNIFEERSKYHKDSPEVLEFIKEELDEELSFDIYDLMSGSEFVNAIEHGSIIDYDGSLSDIFVDGYKTNLGIADDNFMQGEFLMSTRAFSELCNEHDIKVNWANK